MMKFTREHDWLRVEGDTATVGITEFAASELGDLVYVELPKIGTKLKSGSTAVVVESVKTAYDVLSPVGGEVVEINQAAADDPASVTADPRGAGWLYRIKLANAAELDGFLDEADYKTLNT